MRELIFYRLVVFNFSRISQILLSPLRKNNVNDVAEMRFSSPHLKYAVVSSVILTVWKFYVK